MLIVGKVVAIALSVVLANFLINQLSLPRDFRGKTWLLVRLLGYLMAIAIAHEIIGTDVSEDIKQASRYVGVAAGVAVLYEGFGLWQRSRRSPTKESSLAANELLKRLHSDVRLRVKDRLSYAVGDKAIDVSWQSENSAVGRGDSPSLVGPKQNWFLKLLPIGKGNVDIGENILNAFVQEDVNRKLLILGEPGSGKTTTLLKLAEALVNQFETTKQVPYIFELSAWRNDQVSILDWLTEQLKFDHGIDPAISRLWIKQNRLVPLLDGLDELGMKRQKACVDKINEFAKLTGQQVVVCCRSQEYVESEAVLNSLKGALCLQPLTKLQIEKYLRDIGKTNVWEFWQQRSKLADLLETSQPTDDETHFLKIPLFLQILVVAYKDEQSISSKTDLFDAYISHQLKLETRQQHRDWTKNQNEEPKWAYESVEKEPDVEQAKRYLVWLARQLKKNNIPNNFLIEHMQPSWLESTAHRWQYRLIFGLLVGQIAGLMFGRIVGLKGGLIGGLIFGLMFGLLGDLLGGLVFGLDKINPVERFRFSPSRFMEQELWNNLAFGLIVGLTGGIIAGLIGGLIGNLLGGLIFALVFGFMGALRSVLQVSFQTRDVPNQGIKASVKNFVLITPFLYPAGIAIPLLQIILLRNEFAWQKGLEHGISYALLLGFSLTGGLPIIQHLTLRYLLYRQGHIPHNYAKFLKYTTERRLTQQIGGRFRFIHRELLDHFAAMNIEP